MNWATRFKDILVRNWREKLLAVVLAFLFWFMIKAQIAKPPMPQWQQPPNWPPPPPVSTPSVIPLTPQPSSGPQEGR
jgi:hypothetical protein